MILLIYYNEIISLIFYERSYERIYVIYKIFRPIDQDFIVI